MQVMEENVPRYRAGQVVRIPKLLSATETSELRRLFDLVADTCDAAVEVLVLGKAGSPPIGAEFERLRALNDRADTMIDRIKAILD
jgi:hypothetical protein